MATTYRPSGLNFMDNKNISKFEADRLQILSFKIIEESISIPETFDATLISEFDTTNNIQIAFNLEQKLIRSQFDIEISTVSKNEDQAKTNLKFVFIFHCENFEDLATTEGNDTKIDSNLGYAITTLTHSTARGILLTKLSDTVFADFILPVVKPKLPK